MPLTQEKRLDNNFTNNNDHSYLHKKFKKMASTITVFPVNTSKVGEVRHKEVNVEETARNSYISNGSIQASHPEIEKIKGAQNNQNSGVKYVQTNISDENTRLSDVIHSDQVSGKTSFNDEFSNKTENLENDFRDVQSGGTGGRYICPYCKLPCAKPSVLQKHIRAHTNERPYPCVPCGFAFKTKSNLYKHRRSRTHALRLQGADVPVTINDEDMSGGSESDTSLPPTSMSDPGVDASTIRLDSSRPYEFSSPELTNDRITPPMGTDFPQSDLSKSKMIYKPKFRGAFYQEAEENKLKKTISPNADFLTEHISKIISNNEAIVDVIETPLQKKYGKIKQIAESKQFLNEHDIKTEPSPLNLTKNSNDSDGVFRKRSHSESFSQSDHQKHPLNPEGSIIKDLLLKTKFNGLTSVTGELLDGSPLLYICPLCQIVYKSAENLEIHRLYYCKGNFSNNNSTMNAVQKETRIGRPENVYVRSNSVNVRLPETSNSTAKLQVFNKSPPLKIKPDNLIIVKPESNDVIAPLPSPGPLLGNTRLVDTRMSSDYSRKTDTLKAKPIMASPKRRIDSSSDPYSPRLSDNVSPRLADMYNQPKIRCIEANAVTLRSMEEISQLGRHNSTSLQMFGGEVKIVHHSGSTTTLRIEPSKNQLSPILIQPNLSPSRVGNDMEASSVVVRSGLHSGGTIVHNPPTPKEMIGTSKAHTPRISISSVSDISNNLPKIHDITHFQFPPLTAFNPLTLPPLSPSSSNGASTILHGGKLIPHVPGIPGPNTPGTNVATLSKNTDYFSPIPSSLYTSTDNAYSNFITVNGQAPKGAATSNINRNESMRTIRSPNCRTINLEAEKHFQKQVNSDTSHYSPTVPIINIKNVDEPNITSKILSNTKSMTAKQEGPIKRNSEGVPRTAVLKDNSSLLAAKSKHFDKNIPKSGESKAHIEIRNFNFENLITKAEIFNNQIPSSAEVQKNTNAQELVASSNHNERSETAYFQKNVTAKSMGDDRKPKFLRPSTLPLKPGTFTPKRHHGITPNANTMPLVSPETPRPAKAYGQLYLNGNAYTYLGLKCSTKVFYCTINRPQPTYVPNQHFLSMYSNWQLLSELTPDPLGLSASSAMSLYDSRHRPQSVASSVIKQDLILTHSSQWNSISRDSKQSILPVDPKIAEDNKLHITDNAITPKKELAGGFESNEEYTYVRGRGRGRYVCSECGIRCKKPSMLKKHIRTHTDVRPYTCVHCAFSFKTKGNLTKHMKSKAHFKKCCELGINPNEGNDVEGNEMTLGSGETDDDSDSDGDEGNEGETESSDTEVCKSRLPEHEAAHCLLSLGGSRPTTSATPGLITSARPSTYPYTPTGLETTTSELSPDKFNLSRSTSVDSRTDVDNEPMDLSKNDVKLPTNIPDIPTARESSVLASLASNTAKLPHNQTHWSNGEPMLHTYLTERALQDSKIKQSQLSSSLSKLKKIELEKNDSPEEQNVPSVEYANNMNMTISSSQITASVSKIATVSENESVTPAPVSASKDDNLTIVTDSSPSNNLIIEMKRTRTPSSTNAENAKHVVSEYLKHARINLIKTYDENTHNQIEKSSENSSPKLNMDDRDDINNADTDTLKMSPIDHDPVARKVVIGAGGVAFKVTKGKEYEGSSSYLPGRLMEDGRRVCDFCNKTFTKPSQLRLHLNIHYMERPFRCSACAVSFRTRGHLQKHERSGSHHNKVSMTSTFGAATSLNPRPFRCSDCNIAFRIHGHLAKHLRSKMHVMRLECLFKLPFGTFTEIERAGVSLTDIDTTDCASSLASLQSLARKLHEKDPSKLEYREPGQPGAGGAARDDDDDEDGARAAAEHASATHSDRDTDVKTIENSDEQDR